MGKEKLEQGEGNLEDWSGVTILNRVVRYTSLRKQHFSEDWKEVRKLKMLIGGGRVFQQKEPELVQRP